MLRSIGVADTKIGQVFRSHYSVGLDLPDDDAVRFIVQHELAAAE